MNNYLTANWHRFLIVQHLKTLLAPWRRQNPSDFGPRERNFTDKTLDAIADVYIRLIAACIRLTIIFMGLMVELLTLIAFLLLFVIWLAWPAISVFLITKGVNIILVSTSFY